MGEPSDPDRGCSKVLRKISAYVDQELPAEEVLVVEHHLQICEYCRSEEQAYRALWSALEDPLPICAQASLVEEVLNRISEGEADDDRAISIPFRRLWPASAAVAVVCLALGGFLARALMDKEADNTGSRTISRSLDVFSPAPEGTLANGYFAMIQSSGSQP